MYRLHALRPQMPREGDFRRVQAASRHRRRRLHEMRQLPWNL